MDKKIIYCDNAATTAVSKKALDAALPYFMEEYGNASSIYMHGQNSGCKRKDRFNSRLQKLGGVFHFGRL